MISSANGKLNSNDKRSIVVRPERIMNSDQFLKLKISDSEFEICDYSTFGISVYSQSSLKETIGSQIPYIHSSILFDGIDYITLDLKLIYETKVNENLHKIAFEICKEPLNVDELVASVEGLQAFSEAYDEYEHTQNISPAFKAVVSDFHVFLKKLKDTLSGVESQWDNLSSLERQHKEYGIAKIVAQKVSQFIRPIMDRAEHALESVSEEDKMRHVHYFREHLSGLLLKSPFAHRSFYKPSGYAGDFEMMNQIYRNQLEGKDLFAKCLHRYYLDQEAAKAVNNRSVYLQNKLNQVISDTNKSAPIRLLSLACGPAFEIQKLLQNIDPNTKLEIALLDQDVRALQNAQRGIREVILKRDLKNVEVDYRIQSVKHVIVRGIDDGIGYDFIYSSGLFDYLVDDISIATMKQLFKATKAGGQVLIGNFSHDNPNRNMMEIGLDWQLIYRTEEDMQRLASAVTDDVKVESEELGVNLFVILNKN